MKETLKKIGLEDREIEVYLTLLKLGINTATRVSKETNIDRATTYRYLDSLITKGFVSYVIRNNVKYFNSAPPEKILEDIKEKEEHFTRILPQLQSLSKLPKDETVVELYEGKEGIKTIFKTIIKEGKDYFVFGAEEKFEEILPFYSKQFLKSIERKNIMENVIRNRGRRITKIKRGKYKTLNNQLLSPTTTVVYGDKTALFIWSEKPYGILIHSKDVAKSNKEYFNHLWKNKS